jgi:hypothetical protein
MAFFKLESAQRTPVARSSGGSVKKSAARKMAAGGFGADSAPDEAHFAKF